MTKKELAKRIAADVGLGPGAVQAVIQRVFDGIIETLEREGRLELRNFGVFEVRRRKARRARNPRTGDRVAVPERLVVTFSSGRQMARRIGLLAAVPKPPAPVRAEQVAEE